jgi:hypothetical protein
MLAMGVFTVYEAWESSTHKPSVVSMPHRAQHLGDMGVAAAAQPPLIPEATEEERENQEDSTDETPSAHIDEVPPAPISTPQGRPPRMDRLEPRIGRVFSLGSPVVADGHHASDSRTEGQYQGHGPLSESRETEPESPPQRLVPPAVEPPLPEPPLPEPVSREPPAQSQEPATEDASSEQREPSSDEEKPKQKRGED